MEKFTKKPSVPDELTQEALKRIHETGIKANESLRIGEVLYTLIKDRGLGSKTGNALAEKIARLLDKEEKKVKRAMDDMARVIAKNRRARIANGEREGEDF